MRLLAVLLVPLIFFILGATAPQVWAEEIAEQEVFFEFNSTDLDLGFDIFLDAVGQSVLLSLLFPHILELPQCHD